MVEEELHENNMAKCSVTSYSYYNFSMKQNRKMTDTTNGNILKTGLRLAGIFGKVIGIFSQKSGFFGWHMLVKRVRETEKHSHSNSALFHEIG